MEICKIKDHIKKRIPRNWLLSRYFCYLEQAHPVPSPKLLQLLFDLLKIALSRSIHFFADLTPEWNGIQETPQQFISIFHQRPDVCHQPYRQVILIGQHT